MLKNLFKNLSALALISVVAIPLCAQTKRAFDTASIPSTCSSSPSSTQIQARSSVTVSGRIMSSADPLDRGLAYATVILTDTDGNIRTTRANPFGYVRFFGVSVGLMGVVTVSHKRFQFDSKTVSLESDVASLMFVPLGSQ
jgi:hypothetical protein